MLKADPGKKPNAGSVDYNSLCVLFSPSDSWSDAVSTNNPHARSVCCSGYSGHIPSCLSWYQSGKKESEEKTKREEICCGQVFANV